MRFARLLVLLISAAAFAPADFVDVSGHRQLHRILRSRTAKIREYR
jgi:hypothetical protein